jgi:hypothetical protein
MMNGEYLGASSEVCKQIKEIINYIFTREDRELEEFDRKDFRISRKLK